MDPEQQKYSMMVSRARELLDGGADLEKVLEELREMSSSIIQSMKVIRDVLQVPMSEAKLVVHRSRAWSDVRDSLSDVHDEAEGHYKDRTSRNEDGTFSVEIDLRKKDADT